MSKADIASRDDVLFLIERFYEKAKLDELIGSFFTEVVVLDWDHHIPVITDFWTSILLGTVRYEGNPISPHISLHRKKALKPFHFERWLELWEANLKEHFEGPIAEEALRRAKMMAPMIAYKIEQSESPGFIQ